MKKRKFLKVSGVFAATAIASPLLKSCVSQPDDNETGNQQSESTVSGFEQNPLSYDYGALEPHIDAMTMEIHFSKHHAGYVKKLNAALESSSTKSSDLKNLVQSIKAEDAGLRNNGGGHFNHDLFWSILKKGSSRDEMSQELKDAISSAFDSFENFKDKFSESAAKHFGSGWAWLSKKADGSLFISSTENQDNPLMKNIVETPGTPILGIDVWEHAYYLNYENNRKEYISNFFEIVNWSEVSRRFKS